MVNSVSTALIAASSQVKLAETAVGVFQVAKAKHDNSTMDRAMSYAAPAISESLSKSDDAREALEEAQKTAREEAKKRFEESLKENSEKDVPEQIENTKTNDTTNVTEDNADNPDATDTQPAASVPDDRTSQNDTEAQDLTAQSSTISDYGTIGKTVDVSA
jgi:hypothetical protein